MAMATFPSKPITQLLGSNGPTNALSYSAPSNSSSYILTGSSDRSIRLYNPSTISASSPNPPIIATYTSHAYPILSLTISPTNATFASTSTSDRSIFLWDVSTSTVLRRFSSQASSSTGSAGRINCVTFAGSTGEDILISGGFDCAVRIWDVRAQGSNKKEIMVLNEARDSVECVIAGWGAGFGSGGGGGKNQWEIIAGSSDGRVRWYDVRVGKVIEDVIGCPVTSLCRTGDGKGCLVGGLDSKIRLMDGDVGACLKDYKDEEGREKGRGFKNEEFRVQSCFGGRERWVISGNENVEGKQGDGEVVVWDTVGGEVVKRVKVKGGEGPKKKIGPDGKEKERLNVVSCVAWKDNGKGDQWCCGGTDGVVTVFGSS